MIQITGTLVVVDRSNGSVHVVDAIAARHFTQKTLDGNCQVHVEIDPNGNVSDPVCVSVDCKGNCNLQQETNGNITKYWCDCSG
jgi:hypothetical protein